jgi:hypothetical protein
LAPSSLLPPRPKSDANNKVKKEKTLPFYRFGHLHSTPGFEIQIPAPLPEQWQYRTDRPVSLLCHNKDGRLLSRQGRALAKEETEGRDAGCSRCKCSSLAVPPVRDFSRRRRSVPLACSI